MPEPPMTPRTALVMNCHSHASRWFATRAVQHEGDRGVNRVIVRNRRLGRVLHETQQLPHSEVLGLAKGSPQPTSLRCDHARGYSVGARGLSSSGCNSTSCHTFFLVK